MTVRRSRIRAARNPSGEAPPGFVAGWTQLFVEDFITDTAVGSWGVTDGGFGAPAPYAQHFQVYPDGWGDTAYNSSGGSTNSLYMPSQVLSTSNSCLNWRLFNSGSGARSAVVSCFPGSIGQLYGRYVIRFKADPLDGFKTAWLLWPTSENWPTDGEIDFPEGALDGTISAFMHRQNGVNGSDQDGYGTSTTFTDWHTAVIEWSSGNCTFILDGVTVGTSTSRVPNTPMRWAIQCESDLGGNQPASGTAGNVYVDWVAMYSKP